MLTRHRLSLILLTVSVSTASLTGTASASGNNPGGGGIGSTLPPTCNNGVCVTGESGAGGTSSSLNGPHMTPPGGGGGYQPPPVTPICEDQASNGVGHPIYTPYGSGTVSVNGNQYSWIQVRCSFTPSDAYGGMAVTISPTSYPYCAALSSYVDIGYVAAMATGGSSLASYYGVSDWLWAHPTSRAGHPGVGAGGCAAHWLVPANGVTNSPPSSSYYWNYMLSMTPQVNVPAPSFQNWVDPTTNTGGWSTNSFPTFPHVDAATNAVIPNGVPINYPLVVSPQTPATLETGIYSASANAITIPVTVTSANGTQYPEVIYQPVTFTAPYKATFDHMDVWSGTDTASNSAFSGLSVLVQPINPVTPFGNLGNGVAGSLCTPSALGNSAALFRMLGQAESAAVYGGANLATPDGYSLLTQNYNRYGDCSVTFRVPSGAGPGPNGDWPVYATGVWNVVWGDATVSTPTVTRTFVLPTSPPQSVTVTIPGTTGTSATPPAWPTVANSSASSPINLNVGTAEAVPVPVAGGTTNNY